MFIDFKWFEDFLSLARHNNFSRASKERHVTQSAFSRRIKALEIWVGTPLVDRSTYPTQLTPAGKIFNVKAQEVLLLVTDIKHEFNDMKLRGENTIQFTSLHTTALTFFPKWLMDIEADIGSINTLLKADNLHNCVQNMTESDSDYLIAMTHPSVSLVLDPEHYPSLIIGTDRLIPISIPIENNLPKYTLPGTKKKPTPLLTYPEDAYFGRLVKPMIKRQGLSANLEERYVNSFADAIRSMAIVGSGLAWLPESMVLEDLKAGRFVQVEGDQWVIDLDIRIYRHAEPRRPQVEMLWDYLLEKYQ